MYLLYVDEKWLSDLTLSTWRQFNGCGSRQPYVVDWLRRIVREHKVEREADSLSSA